jgi:hypothetical protein
LWSNAGGITKETVTFADGPNAIRFTTGGTDTGIVWQVTFGTGAIPAVGSFVEVTIAGQVLSNIGGGFPGALIRLYTDAALSGGGIRDTTLLFNKTTSGWQTQTVNAAPRAGEGIYGVVIYLIGAWSGMPGGQWNGTIIMDKVEVKVKSPAVVGTIAPGAATSNVSSDVTSSGIAIPNSSSTWDPYGASPGTSVAGPGPSFTHTVGYNYIINSNLNLRWFLNNVTTLFTITVSARLALRDLTAGGNNILIGAGVTMYENWMYDNATGTGNRISNHNHSFTTTVLGSSLIVGHVYQVGVWIGAIRFTDTTGAQVAPGASSFLNIDQDDTVITLKA